MGQGCKFGVPVPCVVALAMFNVHLVLPLPPPPPHNHHPAEFISFAGLVLSKYPSVAGDRMQGAKDVFGLCLHSLKVCCCAPCCWDSDSRLLTTVLVRYTFLGAILFANQCAAVRLCMPASLWGVGSTREGALLMSSAVWPHATLAPPPTLPPCPRRSSRRRVRRSRTFRSSQAASTPWTTS